MKTQETISAVLDEVANEPVEAAGLTGLGNEIHYRDWSVLFSWRHSDLSTLRAKLVKLAALAVVGIGYIDRIKNSEKP